jgi:hypothetical protein
MLSIALEDPKIKGNLSGCHAAKPSGVGQRRPASGHRFLVILPVFIALREAPYLLPNLKCDPSFAKRSARF